MLCDLNPIILSTSSEDEIEQRLFRLREYMEDPANKLNIDAEMRIEGDNKAQVYQITDKICKQLLQEE